MELKKKNNLNLYSVIIKFFSKKGKIQKNKKALHFAFIRLVKKTKLPIHRVLLKLIFSLYTYLEVKPVKMRRRLNIIPFSIRSSRRYFIVLKKIRNVLQRKKMSIEFKLYLEFLNILQQRSRANEMKDLNISQAYANRSNTHYRWFF